MRTIRASDIGAYVYCQRAWWYQERGYESGNQEEMAMGSEMHYQHGRRVMVSGCIQMAAYGLLLIALVLMAVYVTGRVL
jgi:CRISPR/Cas system-associated exonuclease Cas4 (RecB family)